MLMLMKLKTKSRIIDGLVNCVGLEDGQDLIDALSKALDNV